MINGTAHPWEKIEIFLDGVLLADAVEINYSDKKPVTAIYGAGSRPIAAGKGNYAASGDITLRRPDYETINNVARVAGKKLYDYKPFIIIVSYASDEFSDDSKFVGTKRGPLKTDMLLDCIFQERKFGAKQGDTDNTIRLDLFITDID
jgi:hypothetical protein